MAFDTVIVDAAMSLRARDKRARRDASNLFLPSLRGHNDVRRCGSAITQIDGAQRYGARHSPCRRCSSRGRLTRRQFHPPRLAFDRTARGGSKGKMRRDVGQQPLIQRYGISVVASPVLKRRESGQRCGSERVLAWGKGGRVTARLRQLAEAGSRSNSPLAYVLAKRVDCARLTLT